MNFKQIIVSTAAGAGLLLAGNGIANADTITVKSGDTVSSIAKTYKTTVRSIEKINHLANVNAIYVGQKLETSSESSNGSTVSAQPNYQQYSKQQVAPQAHRSSNNVKPAIQTSNGTQQAASTNSSSNTASSTTSSSASSRSASSSSSSEAAAKSWIVSKESGGSYTASNGQYYGKYQLSKSYLNGDLSASNQDSVADSYVSSRYGSWTAAKDHWEANGWY